MSKTEPIKNWISAIGILALLGASLGGMGSYWHFFWVNRDMCPCAAEGITADASLKSEVAEPYSDAVMRSRVLTFSGIGVAMGTVTGLLLSFKDRQRMKQFLSENEEEDRRDS